jgi:lycopene beta-cyclase
LKHSDIPTHKKYDYIIGGAGLSGLTLALKLYETGLLEKHTLLLIDPSDKSENDRTWSFWNEKLPELTYLPIKNSWDKAVIKSNTLNHTEDLLPYTYYNIEGIDYYNYVKNRLKDATNIEWLKDTIIEDEPHKKEVITASASIAYTHYFFKSHFFSDELSTLLSDKDKSDFFLWQHFLGYKIRFKEDRFKPNQFTYMDMTIPQQQGGLSFMYVLPFSENTALVEYTLFSNKLLERTAYEEMLLSYIKTEFGDDYEIEAEEYNKIPMSTKIKIDRINNVIPIGTLGGVVKASTGYSFLRNLKHATHIVNQLKRGTDNFKYPISKRHQFYDKVLINVIASQKSEGLAVFNALYKNDLKLLFKFLDEETTIWEDLKIMRSVPTWPFIKGVWASLLD